MDFEFETEHTGLANDFAAAGGNWLAYMGIVDTVLAPIPCTQPQKYAIAGTLPGILQMAGKMMSEEGAHAAQWISVADSLPEKYCLAVYETPSGKQRIIRAMYVAKFTVEAQGDDCYSEINDENDIEYLREGWYELIDNWGEYSSVNVCEGVVTHWQPLPPLPSLTTPASAERSGDHE